MKISLNSISLFTDISPLFKSLSIVELAHLYSIHTAEIDDVLHFWKEKKVLIWKILSCKKHPDSDHLNIVEVDLWDTWIKQIVCWADNVSSAELVAVATVWSILGTDFEIKEAKLRWQISQWMICSEDELWFQEDRAPGIMKLEDYFDKSILLSNIWKPFYDLEISIPWIWKDEFKMKLSDIVFEIDNKFITNRPDLFSVEWNSREFWAIFNLPFTSYNKDYKFNKWNIKCNIESDKVLAYNLVKVDNAISEISPFSIRYSLYKSWIASKFDLVDMTNYVMTELWQPMHAFDADKIDWNITVRQAKTWEKILALNWNEYELNENDLVIADNSKILAIAWIIWGQSSAISETTKNIYIESACFDPTSIRLTSLRLWVRTDSSTRYEKSLDPLLTNKALSRALDFLTFLKKNYNISWDFNYLKSNSINEISIDFTSDFIAKKIWISIPDAEIIRISKALWFEISWYSSWFTVKVPSFRATKDISIKEDIAEEIWRIYSYDKVPEIPLSWDISITRANKKLELKSLVRDYFANKWFYEVYNYSFSNENLDEKIWIKDHENSIKVINAYSNEFTLYRREMSSYILKKTSENINNSGKFAIYEIWKIWKKINQNSFEEKQKLAWIWYWIDFSEFKSKLDWFLSLVSKNSEFEIIFGTDLTSYRILHPNKSWKINYNNEEIWYFWYLNPKTASLFEIDDSKSIYFEFDFDKLLSIYTEAKIIFKEIPKFPWIDRELNFVMDEKTRINEVIRLIKWCNEIIRDVSIIDIYRNEEKIWKDKKSISFSILLQDYEKTINDESALTIQNKIINTLAKSDINIRS